jgi:hypothetical protein
MIGGKRLPTLFLRRADQVSTRRGTSILEVVVSGVLLVALMTVCLEFLRAAAAQRRAAQQRQTAIQEAANVMERLSARPWEELSPQGVAGLELSQPARDLLPAVKLAVEVTSPPDQPGAKRIAVSVYWEDDAGEPVRPVCLIAWRYRP